MPDKVLDNAKATATGDGRGGHVVSSDDRLDLDLAPPVELGGSGDGTNPEQLFAAGYSACFHNALPVLPGHPGEHWCRAARTVTGPVLSVDASGPAS